MKIKIQTVEIDYNRKVNYYKWGKALSNCTICNNYYGDITNRETTCYIYNIDNGKQQQIYLCKNHKDVGHHVALMNRK